MNYEEALAYYPAVVASRDVAAFVAPVAEAGPGEAESILWAAWQTVVASADERLVPLVAGVRRHLPELPLFGAAMQAAWDEPPAGEAWTRLNAFAARLTPDVADFLRLGLLTIGSALETFADPAAQVPAAVEWFHHAGPPLLAATLHGRTYVSRLGELAVAAGVAAPGFSVPRWVFWRTRMAALADQGFRPARDGVRFMKRYDRQIAAAHL